MAIPADVRQWEVRTRHRAGDEDDLAAPVARSQPASVASPAGPFRARFASGDRPERRTGARTDFAGTSRPRPRIVASGTPWLVAVPIDTPMPCPVARPDSQRPSRRHPRADAFLARARALWPGLDARRLAGTRGDPARIVRLVARHSNEAPDVLLRMLLAEELDRPR